MMMMMVDRIKYPEIDDMMMIRTQNQPQPNTPLINLVPEIEKLREIRIRGKLGLFKLGFFKLEKKKIR